MTAAVRAARNVDSQPGADPGREEHHRRRRGQGRRREDHAGRQPGRGAVAAAAAEVGLIDGDIYGPNVPIMLGVQAQLMAEGDKILPAEKYGIKVVSMGFLTNDDSPVIWRGPMLHSVIQQFFHDVQWGELDYLVIDMPPGTGDVALSLSQTVPVAGAIVVTTPQEVSLADSRRAVRMYQKLNIPVLGIVENMSYFVVPELRARERHLRPRRRRADGARDGGAVPRADPDLRADPRGRRRGQPLVIAEPDSPAARAFMRGGRADRRAGVDRELPQAGHPGDGGALEHGSRPNFRTENGELGTENYERDETALCVLTSRSRGSVLTFSVLRSRFFEHDVARRR